MIDGITSKITGFKHSVIGGNYSADDAVTHRLMGYPVGERLAVLLPPWHGGGHAYSHLAQRLMRLRFATLSYDFHDHILEPNVERVIKSHEVIADRICGDLDKLSPDYDSIHFIASSLGNVALGLIASQFQDFDSATMLVAGSSLAKGVWEGSRTQKIRKAFEAQGLQEDDLEAAWESIAPSTHAAAFNGKNVQAHVSLSDRVIPTYQQQDMADVLTQAGAHTVVNETSSGHYWTVAKYCLFEPIEIG